MAESSRLYCLPLASEGQKNKKVVKKMDRQMLEMEYAQAWEELKQARLNVQIAQKNFHDVCGLLMEQLMLDNVDVLARLKDSDTPTI